MAIPVNIETLLRGKVVEWERLDFKRGWNPEDVMHTMCAFANDIHNWGGGYIIIGIEENNGVPILPPEGISLHDLDDIQKDLVRLCKLIQPDVNILTEPIEYQGKMIFVIHVPGGELRPYKAPINLNKESEKLGKVYWIRQGSVTRRANEEEERMLMALCNKVPYDDRINQNFDINVLDKGIIADYLQKVGSKMTFRVVMQSPIEEIGWNMQIIGGQPEFLRPKNIGLMMFTPDPEKYIPCSHIEIVRFKNEVGDEFEEEILQGPLYMQLRKALDYLRAVCVEKVMKVKNEAEAVRRWNYPYDALEEIVSNAVYHKSYDEREPIEIRIYPTFIEVLNFAGPVPPITNADLQKPRVVNRHYRNRRIGSFLKELNFTEGRSTGFPKIYRAINNNDSPKPKFETDENNSYFLATLYIHQAFIDDVAYLKSIGKEYADYKENGEKDGELNGELNGEKESVDDTKNETNADTNKLNDNQRIIITLIKDDEKVTIPEMILKTKVSRATINRELKALREQGIITRIGDKRSGHWQINELSSK